MGKSCNRRRWCYPTGAHVDNLRQQSFSQYHAPNGELPSAEKSETLRASSRSAARLSSHFVNSGQRSDRVAQRFELAMRINFVHLFRRMPCEHLTQFASATRIRQRAVEAVPHTVT